MMDRLGAYMTSRPSSQHASGGRREQRKLLGFGVWQADWLFSLWHSSTVRRLFSICLLANNRCRDLFIVCFCPLSPALSFFSLLPVLTSCSVTQANQSSPLPNNLDLTAHAPRQW